jgi:hypothetical protein
MKIFLISKYSRLEDRNKQEKRESLMKQTREERADAPVGKKNKGDSTKPKAL